MKKMLFVMNPNAGTRKANRYLAQILSIFNQAGYIVLTHMTTGVGDGTRVVAQLAGQVDLVACCGGDGTFSETLNGVIQSGANVPIGYIPAGSTNDFAASLRLSSNILQAARDIVEGQVHLCDVGQFADRYFCYVASFGIFTRASYATPQSIKNTLGHTAYLLGGIQELSQIRTTHMRLELDGEEIEDDFLFGAISNSTSVGGILTLDAKQVDMGDGKFELLLIRSPRHLSELSECIQALQSQKYNCSMLTFRSATHVRVVSDEPLTWTLDGERAEAKSILEIRNLHHAMQIIRKG